MAFGWIKKLFGMADRTERAADRIAEEMEGIADDLHGVRVALRQRLGLDAPTPAALPAPAEEVPAVPPREEAATVGTRAHKRNGHKPAEVQP